MRKPAPAWLHRRRPGIQPNGRTQTIARLIAAAREAGRELTDADLAATLAISVDRVRRHRGMLGR